MANLRNACPGASHTQVESVRKEFLALQKYHKQSVKHQITGHCNQTSSLPSLRQVLGNLEPGRQRCTGIQLPNTNAAPGTVVFQSPPCINRRPPQGTLSVPGIARLIARSPRTFTGQFRRCPWWGTGGGLHRHIPRPLLGGRPARSLAWNLRNLLGWTVAGGSRLGSTQTARWKCPTGMDLLLVFFLCFFLVSHFPP